MQIGATEVIYGKSATANPHLMAVLTRSEIFLSEKKPKQFTFQEQTFREELDKIFQNPSCKDKEKLAKNKRILTKELDFSNIDQIEALHCLISDLKLTDDFTAMNNAPNAGDNSMDYEIEIYNLQKYARLDSGALKSLNLMPSVFDTSKNMSLFGLLDQCKTKMGSRKLGQWIRQPLLDYKEIGFLFI